MKHERKTKKKKNTLGEPGDGESEKETEGEREKRVENTGSIQLQLRERFCAREYANSSFV